MYWAYHKMNMDTLLNDIKSANYFWIGAAFFAGILSHLVRTLRWRMLIEPIAHEPRLKTSFYAVMAGYLINFLVPRMGEVSKCALLSQTDRISFEKLVGTVVTERIMDVIVMLLIVLAVIFFQYDLISGLLAENVLPLLAGGSNKLLILGITGTALLILGYVAFRYRQALSKNVIIRKVLNFLAGLAEGAKSVFQLKKPGLFIFYSLFMWVLYFFMAYWIFFALDSTSHLGIDAALTTLLMGTLAIAVPSPGGIGTYHTFVPAGLALFGVDPETGGKTYALISHGTQMIMIFLAGGISLILIALEKRKNV
jgi:uncharacterized protein (TIRG00374 family)